MSLLKRIVDGFDEAGYAVMELALFLTLILSPFLFLIALTLGPFFAALWMVIYIGRLLSIPFSFFGAISALTIAGLVGLSFPGMARRATEFYKTLQQGSNAAWPPRNHEVANLRVGVPMRELPDDSAPRDAGGAATSQFQPPSTPEIVRQQKTLICPECRSANYSTEWYCERCGRDLDDVSQSEPLRECSTEAVIASGTRGIHTALKADATPQPAGTLLCPECRAVNDPTEWYCKRCGGEIQTDSSNPGPPPVPSATVEVLDLGYDASARWDSSNGAGFKLWIEQRGRSLSVDDKGITAFMGYAEDYLKGVFHPHFFALNASGGVLVRGDGIELEWEPTGGPWCSIFLGKQGVRKLADFLAQKHPQSSLL